VPAQSPDHEAFGRAIRSLRRERLDVSQEEFADLCELDRTYIGGIERGERNLGLRNILKIADALGITTDALFARFEHERVDQG
jgi:transcriptional regulator with XRE-family HTH domain